MKILFVVTALQTGGAERQVVDIADHCFERGHQVKIAYLTGKQLIQPKTDDIEVLCLSMRKNLVGFVRAYLKLQRIVRSFRPDVVHSHMVHANLLARLVRLGCSMPKLVCTAHSKNEGGWMRMLAYRVTDCLADLSTNVSVEAVEEFEKKRAVPQGKMLPIHNGIDTQRFRRSDSARDVIRAQEGVCDDEKVVLAVGRLTEAKDYFNLFRAFNVLSNAGQYARLWIIGDGELRESLENEVNSYYWAGKVSFYRFQKEIAAWINAADVFVLSSAWEGFGLVVAEAMACEKVVVATDSGGVKEVLGDAGYLVPPSDHLSLANSLNNALNISNMERIEMGNRARKRVIKLYSINNIVERWLFIYSNSQKNK